MAERSAPPNRLIAEAKVLAGGEHPCSILGHKWVFIGGKNCGCYQGSTCSVPVHECEVCGDCDYGDNEDAAETRERCVYRMENALG